MFVAVSWCLNYILYFELFFVLKYGPNLDLKRAFDWVQKSLPSEDRDHYAIEDSRPIDDSYI